MVSMVSIIGNAYMLSLARRRWVPKCLVEPEDRVRPRRWIEVEPARLASAFCDDHPTLITHCQTVADVISDYGIVYDLSQGQ